MRRADRLLLLCGSLAVACVVWLPLIHTFYGPRPVPFLREQVRRWTRPAAAELATLRGTNPEWDLLARTFAVLALTEQALRHPEHAGAHLEALDRLLRQTLREERHHGFEHFLLPYGRRGGWRQLPPASHFVDGELTLMLGLRRLLADDDPALREAFRQRVAKLQRRMASSPTLSAESYPDECWTFCNTIALAALRLAERLDGHDTRKLPERWVALARRRLLDPSTGLLISSYTLGGRRKEGPEGSSIWLSTAMLALVDRRFAAEQYKLARRHLGRVILGFGYAREWPLGAPRRIDVDSGLLVPGLEASPSSSGFALLAARALGDESFSTALQATLELAAYPQATAQGGRRYLASNAVGDSVLFAALTQGALRRKLARGAARAGALR